jgi:hypothetical protein
MVRVVRRRGVLALAGANAQPRATGRCSRLASGRLPCGSHLSGLRRLRCRPARRGGRRPCLAPGRRRVHGQVRPDRGGAARHEADRPRLAGAQVRLRQRRRPLADRHGNLLAPAVLSPTYAVAAAVLLLRRTWSVPVALLALVYGVRSVRRVLPNVPGRNHVVGWLAIRGLGWAVRQESTLLLGTGGRQPPSEQPRLATCEGRSPLLSLSTRSSPCASTATRTPGSTPQYCGQADDLTMSRTAPACGGERCWPAPRGSCPLDGRPALPGHARVFFGRSPHGGVEFSSIVFVGASGMERRFESYRGHRSSILMDHEAQLNESGGRGAGSLRPAAGRRAGHRAGRASSGARPSR